MSSEDDLVSIAILIDNLRHENISTRISSVRKLVEIAKALGQARTRDELLPYLGDCMDDEDEVLVAIAEELPSLFDCLGGGEYAFHLLKPLEAFACVEEACVREQAVKSIKLVGALMNDSDISKHLFPVVQRLATGDWFTSRVSACHLFCTLYPHVLPQLKEECLTDETPMVRRAACSQLGNFTSTLESRFILSEIIPVFSNLSKDEQDSVRILTVETAIEVAKNLTLEDTASLVAPCVFSLTSDPSWRVRYACSNHFVKLCSAVGEFITKNDMVDEFIKLLQDPEAEVRTAAAAKVTEFCSLLGPDLSVQYVVPKMKELVLDTCEFTRASLASVVMGLASILHKQDVFEHLLPVFLQLLKDSNPEVRLNIISKLEAINQVIGVDLLSHSLLPAIKDLANDLKWRIRLAIIQHVPLLAQQLGVEFFESQLSDLCMSWLGDKVFSIREAATVNLTRLTEIFGVAWSQSTILPKLSNVAESSNYLYRMTCVYALTNMIQLFDADRISQSMLPFILKLANDNVPNVRFNVAKLLSLTIPILSTAALLQVRPILVSMVSDEDVDVRFFSQQALELCDSKK